jgi:hypothetical protein
MASLHPWLDGTLAPLYVLRLPANDEHVEAQVALFVESHRKFWQSVDRRIALVTDITHVREQPAALRKALADVDRELHGIQKKYLVAWAVILARPVQRFLLQGYLWMAPPASPHAVFGEAHAGLAWARARLAAEGIDVPTEGVSAELESARDLAAAAERRVKRLTGPDR